MFRTLLRGGACAALIFTLLVRALAAQSPVSVKVRAAIVDENMTVRAVPQTKFFVIGARNDTTTIETDLDGIAEAHVQPGIYRLVSAAAIRMDGSTYRWSVPVEIVSGMRTIELTQRNAVAERTPSVRESVSAGRRVGEEAGVFNSVKSGVFVVSGAAGHGSGFLIDAAGIVLTNAHVVNGVEPDQVRVRVDAKTAVRGRLLFLDKDHDVAAIAIHPEVSKNSSVLSLASVAAGESIATEGERVLAIGSPLHQQGILTIGIVSKVEPRAIISDVNINSGNSGGPMLNLDGKVIAINTFADPDPQGGPGLSGSVLITQASHAIRAAKDSLAKPTWQPPSKDLLPVLGSMPFPLDALKAAATLPVMNLKPYVLSEGAFDIQVMTPRVTAFRASQADKELQARRQKREVKAGVTENEKVDNIQAWYGWEDFLRTRTAAVVVQVEPKVAQTGSSRFLNMLGAVAASYSGTYYSPHAVLAFKSDFRRMTLLRDGVRIDAVEEHRIPTVLNVADYRVSGKDLAYQGVYAYRPEDFAPHADGTMPRLQLVITNTSTPNEPVVVEIGPETIMAVHIDFESHRLAQSESTCVEDPHSQACASAVKAAAVEAGRAATEVAKESGMLVADDTDMFVQPSLQSTFIMRVTKGTPIVVVRSHNRWWTYVRVGNNFGYIDAKTLVKK